eukprot:1183455-Prorocentrum_minimum.AAC.2
MFEIFQSSFSGPLQGGGRIGERTPSLGHHIWQVSEIECEESLICVMKKVCDFRKTSAKGSVISRFEDKLRGNRGVAVLRRRFK